MVLLAEQRDRFQAALDAKGEKARGTAPTKRALLQRLFSIAVAKRIVEWAREGVPNGLSQPSERQDKSSSPHSSASSLSPVPSEREVEPGKILIFLLD